MSRSKQRSHCTIADCRMCCPWKDYGNGEQRFRAKERGRRRALADDLRNERVLARAGRAPRSDVS